MSSEAPQAIVDSSDDDEDLKLALALSLQDSQRGSETNPIELQSRQSISNTRELIALDSEDEDEDDDDLDLPHRFSGTGAPTPFDGSDQQDLPEPGHSLFTSPHKAIRHNANGISPKKPVSMSGHVKAESANVKREEQPLLPTTPTKRGILGMNRAAMEAERLARVNKRRASISPPSLQRDHKRRDIRERGLSPEEVGSDLPALKNLISQKSPIDLENIGRKPVSYVTIDDQQGNLKGKHHPKEVRKQGQSSPQNTLSPVAASEITILSNSSRTITGEEDDTTNSSSRGHASVQPEPSPDFVILPTNNLPKSHGRTQPETSPDLVILPAKPSVYTTPKLIGLAFPNGTVLKTWAFGHERSDDIKIEEVLQRSTLKLAVISSFQWDMEWLNSKIDCGKTKLILVMQAKGEAQKAQYREETKEASYLRLCFPPMDPMVNCMHSKLMLLSHKDYLRIVVPTANVTPYDWGETQPRAVMENSVFIIDLPHLPERAKPEDMTDFAKELICFVEAMGLHKEAVQSLYAFDFSATKGLAFVHSIGGAHAGEAWRRTGYCGLGKAVKDLGLATDSELDIDFIASSIGAINHEFLATIYLAAQGDDGMKEYTSRYGDKLRGRHPAASLTTDFLGCLDQRFRVFFPSEDTIVSSTGGKNCAGVICFQAKWWESAKFPRKVMRDCKSKRKGLLMHNKVCSLLCPDFTSAGVAGTRLSEFTGCSHSLPPETVSIRNSHLHGRLTNYGCRSCMFSPGP